MSSGLERFPLLAGLSEADQRVLSERLEWLDVPPRSVLFREGEPADALLLLLEGQIRVSSERRHTEGDLGAGATLGALALVVDGPREATAETRSACRVLRLTREGFLGLRASSPAAACKLLEGVVRESAVFARDALAHLVDRSLASQ